MWKSFIDSGYSFYFFMVLCYTVGAVIDDIGNSFRLDILGV